MIPSVKPLSDKTGQRLFCTQQLTKNPPVSPCVARCGGFLPRVGNRPAPGPQGPNLDPCQAGWKRPKKGSRRSVKEEQVKGCGSVNRPAPGSQRPAEPGASGFFPGGNSPVFMGQFWRLGVRLWVRKQEKPGIPGKIRGSGRGFGPIIQIGGTYDRRKKQPA